MERRARLHGLDKPQKIAHTDPTGEKSIEEYGREPNEIRVAILQKLVINAPGDEPFESGQSDSSA
jgi:hypothetical protein